MNTLIQSLHQQDGVVAIHNVTVCDKHREAFRRGFINQVAVASPCTVCEREEARKHQDWAKTQDPWLSKLMPDKTVYVAGPMTGLPDFNRAAFWRMEHLLKVHGCRVMSPANYPDMTLPYETYMQQDLEMLMAAGAVVMLLGWKESRGATLEHDVADIVKKEIYYEL